MTIARRLLSTRPGFSVLVFYAALAGYLALSVRQTILDRNAWPLASYSMFARIPPPQFWIQRVELTDDAGVTVTVPAERLLPVEFFRAEDIFRHGLNPGLPPARRQAFAAAVLARLNEGWSGFAERQASVAPAPARRLVSFKLLMLRFELPRAGWAEQISASETLFDSALGR